MTTLTDIRNLYPEAEVEQFHSMQMFIVYTPSYNLLLSYTTIVGLCNYQTKIWLLTEKKYSTTTTRQLNRFASQTFSTRWIKEAALQDYLQEFVD